MVAAIFIERTLKIDDPVGAIAVHGVNGAWGVLALGLFADGTYGDGLNGVPGTVKGLFYGDASQLTAELIGVVACMLFTFTAFFLFFKLLEATIGNRVSARGRDRGARHGGDGHARLPRRCRPRSGGRGHGAGAEAGHDRRRDAAGDRVAVPGGTKVRTMRSGTLRCGGGSLGRVI